MLTLLRKVRRNWLSVTPSHPEALEGCEVLEGSIGDELSNVVFDKLRLTKIILQ